MSGQQNPDESRLQQIGQALLNTAHQILGVSGAGTNSTGAGMGSYFPMPTAGAGTGSYVPMQTAGRGMGIGSSQAVAKYFPSPKPSQTPVDVLPWMRGYTSQAGPSWDQGNTGAAGGSGQTGPTFNPYQAAPLAATRDEVNSASRLNALMVSEISGQVGDITKWAKENGYKAKRQFQSFERIDPDINAIEAHQIKNSITNAAPAYAIKTTEGQTAYDTAIREWSSKKQLTMAQIENFAYAAARNADEDFEERLLKKAKLLPADSTTSRKDECMQVYKDMIKYQDSILPDSDDTKAWARKCKAVSGTRIKEDKVKIFGENMDIIGFIYFLSKQEPKGNPFEKPDEATMAEFNKFKEKYGFPAVDDWDGKEDSCSFPEA